MQCEIEATFANVKPEEVREKLEAVGAKMIKPRFLQKRVVFDPPKKENEEHRWLRVRQEQDQVTFSLKAITGAGIHDQKEICLKIDSFENGAEMCRNLGYAQKGYQENWREMWLVDGCEVVIDEWPFLEPMVEVEGESEEIVRSVSEKLNFDWGKALFSSTKEMYMEKYSISGEAFDQIPKIIFEMENPFL